MKRFIKIWLVVSIVAVYLSYYSRAVHADLLPSDVRVALSELRIYPNDNLVQEVMNKGNLELTGYATPVSIFPPTLMRESVTLWYTNGIFTVMEHTPRKKLDIGALIVMCVLVITAVVSGKSAKHNTTILPVCASAIAVFGTTAFVTTILGFAFTGLILSVIIAITVGKFYESSPAIFFGMLVSIMLYFMVATGAPIRVVSDWSLFILITCVVEGIVFRFQKLKVLSKEKR